MTTESLLALVQERGLRIELRDGRPVLVGAANNPEATDKLLAVLKIHREWIIERLKRESHD
jgi:hypothetical protein